MSTLQKAEHVLHHNGFNGNHGGTVEFFREADEDEAATSPMVRVPAAIWEDMGEPFVVTVTVEPGDRLNR